MQIELSPICKTLIALLAGQPDVMTIADVNAALPDADRRAVRETMHTLVRATVVHQAIRWSDERLVYWLSGNTVPSFACTPYIDPAHHWPEVTTFADVGGIPHKENAHG